MARSGFNDDGNEPRYNFVPHVAGSDEERGLPVKGKLVWRSDTETYEYCTDTSPDSTLYGGGTWAALSGGGALANQGYFTADLTQGVAITQHPSTIGTSTWAYSGYLWQASFSAIAYSTGTSGELVKVSLPNHRQFNGSGAGGYGEALVSVGGTAKRWWVQPYDNWQGDPVTYPTVTVTFVDDNGTSLGLAGSSEQLHASDQINGQVRTAGFAAYPPPV